MQKQVVFDLESRELVTPMLDDVHAVAPQNFPRAVHALHDVARLEESLLVERLPCGFRSVGIRFGVLGFRV